jgi:Cohesin loading factor
MGVRKGSPQLAMMRMILHVLYLTKLGNGNAATARLREQHQLVDSILDSDTQRALWDAQGSFLLNCSNGTQRLHFQWFNLDEACIFGYLMSGVVNLPDSASIKANSFLKEGMRVTDSMILGWRLTRFTCCTTR